jgi:hypothetical protein
LGPQVQFPGSGSNFVQKSFKSLRLIRQLSHLAQNLLIEETNVAPQNGQQEKPFKRFGSLELAKNVGKFIVRLCRHFFVLLPSRSFRNFLEH